MCVISSIWCLKLVITTVTDTSSAEPVSVLQVFYWSHLSYIWVWSLLMVHCANFWKWFVVPGLVFLLEKIVGIAVSRMGGLYIVEVNLLPSKVTNRPITFNISWSNKLNM